MEVCCLCWQKHPNGIHYLYSELQKQEENRLFLQKERSPHFIAAEQYRI